MKGTQKKRESRHRRVRAKIFGTAGRPRLVVFRSNRHLRAQLVDDEKGYTLASVSDLKMKKGKKMEIAKTLGLEIAKTAKEKSVARVVFDRGGYTYHGNVKAIAEGAREGGLIF